MTPGRRPNLTLITTQSQSQTLQLALDAFLDDKRAEHCTPKTLTYYHHELSHFVDFAKTQDVTGLTGITPPVIRAYLIALQERGLKGTSQHGAFRAIRAWLNWCVGQKWLDESPMRYVAMPRQEQDVLAALSVEDVRALLEAAENARDKAIILCLLDSGMRASEFVALNVGDYDKKEGTVLVREGKGRKQRTTFFGPKARAQLALYLYSRGRTKASDALWVSEHGGTRLTVVGLQQALRRIAKRAGVPGVSPHAFRRTCALWAHRDGWRVTEIQRLLGHADLSVLKRYLDLDDSDIAEAHRNAPPSGRL